MAKLLKLRRGTTSQHSSFTGAEGEVTVDTDKETLVVHDGSTAGGHPVAAEDMANVSSASIAGRLGTDSIATTKIAAGALPTDVTVADANISGNLTIESADIVDGTIVNADINASAAIANSKLANSSVTIGGTAIALGGTATDVGGLNVFSATKISSHVSGQVNSITLENGKVTFEGGTADNFETNLTVTDPTADRTLTLPDVSGTLAISDSVGGTNVLSSNSVDVGGVSTASEMEIVFTTNGNGSNRTLGCGSGSDDFTYNPSTKSLTVEGNISTTDLNVSGNIKNGTAILDIEENTRFEFDIAGTEYLDVNAGGIDVTGAIVATGNISGGETLTVSGNAPNITFTDTSHNPDYKIYTDSGNLHIYDSTNSATRFQVNSDGHVDVAGNLDVGAGLDVTGAIVASGDVTAFSDATLKTEINTINDALGIVGKLRGVSYKWLHTGKPSIGVIAQEIEEVIPEIVHTTEHEGKDVKSVDYGKIVGVLINAINELKAELDEHKKGGK